MKVTDEMVTRFLGWKLPEDFHPDAGISFTPHYNVEYNAKHGLPPARHEPVGTNLFTADQAKAMLEHVLADTGERSATDDRYSTPRKCWQDGLEAAAHYIENSTFGVNDMAVVGAAAALIRSLKDNTMFGPKDSAPSHVGQTNATPGELAGTVKLRSRTLTEDSAAEQSGEKTGNEGAKCPIGRTPDAQQAKAREGQMGRKPASPALHAVTQSSTRDSEPKAFALPDLEGPTPCTDNLLGNEIGRMVALDPAYHYVKRLVAHAEALERLFWRERKSSAGLMKLLADARSAIGERK